MKFQLLSAYINLAGSRDNVVFRGANNPITFPEALVLRAIHGGSEHVHTLVEIGSVERSPDEEFERLQIKYGAVATAMFPGAAGRANLPARDDSIPTLDEVKAAKAAADKALADRKKQRSKTAKSEPDPEPTTQDTTAPAVPDLVGE